MTLLRFDPVQTSGVNIQLDWVRLAGAPTAANTLNVTWTVNEAPPGARVEFYYDDDTNPANGVIGALGATTAAPRAVSPQTCRASSNRGPASSTPCCGV